jgi:hypothetical protein
MKYSTLIFCVFFFLFSACKNEKTAAKQTDTTNNEAVKVQKSENKNTPAPPSIPTTELKQEQPLSAYAVQFYTNLLWQYETAIVINDDEKGKEYQGKWIKFKPDNTIETGFYDGPIKTGRWALNEGTNVLTIVEDGAHPTYTEWKIKTSSSSNAIMVWVGTKRFGLNNTQIKMIRHSELPKRAE